MKIFFLRALVILSFVFFEISFFDVLFPWVSAPLILILSVIAWALVSGFPRALFMVIPLTALFDVVSSGILGTPVLYSVLLVYATGFLSRRLVAEHRGIGMVWYALYAGGAVYGYALFDFLFSQGSPFLWTAEPFFHFFLVLPYAELFFSAVLAFLFFAVVYRIVRRFEAYTGSIAEREFVQVK